jgi:nuclease S1
MNGSMNGNGGSRNDSAFSGSLDEVFAGILGLVKNGSLGPFRLVYVEVAGGGDAQAVASNGIGADPLPLRGSATGAPLPGSTGYELEWNLQGHAVIAYLAEDVLQDESPEAFRRLQQIIGNDPHNRGDIGELAMWPDRIKHPPQGQWKEYDKLGWVALGKKTQSWHFVDIPYRPGTSDPPQIPEPEPNAPTILQGLPEQLQELAAPKDDESAANALAFVIHLVGDLHQPLHCACLATDRFPAPRFDMGGNLVVWGQSEKNPPSLHKLWDDSVAARPADVAITVAKLQQKFPRSAFKNDGSRDLQDWAIDSHLLARKAYDRFLADTTFDAQSGRYSHPSKAYLSWAMEVAQERVALAAYRLTDLLIERLQEAAPAPTPSNGKGRATGARRGDRRAGAIHAEHRGRRPRHR